MQRFIFLIYFILICFFILPENISATTAESVNQQISDVNNQIKILDKEIAQYQQQISQTSEQSNTLANLIKELTLTRNKLLKETTQTEKKIMATGIVIGTLNDTITAEQKNIDNSKEVLSNIFRNIYQHDSISLVTRLISKKSLIEINREYNDLLSVNNKVNTYIEDLIKQQNILNNTKNNKEIEQHNLTTLKKALTQKKLAVDIAKKEKDTLLRETKNKESNYKKLLVDRQKKRDAFEKDLRNYEDQLKFILNPNLLPAEGSGILSWPLDKIYITQLFGKTIAARRLYVSGSHSGVDFRASLGTAVKSMGSGEIIGTGDTDIYCKGASFGKWVFIKYNNGLSSTFGHLSMIYGKTGQKVTSGDTVGLSGNTGHSTGPHLHVTIYASEGASVKTLPSISCNGKTFIMPIASSKAYLDPMLYLSKISSNKIKNDTIKD